MKYKNILAGYSVLLVSVLLLAGSAIAQTSLRYTQDVYFGLKNLQVDQLQQDLAKDAAVYPEKLVTGYFRPLTLRAVNNFQAKYEIQQTGYVRPPTLAKLNQLYGATASGKVWGCRPVTQGVTPDPNNPPLTVCGYLPTCSNGQSLVTSLGEGTWPDGSHKGTFACSFELPPSIPQQLPDITLHL